MGLAGDDGPANWALISANWVHALSTGAICARATAVDKDVDLNSSGIAKTCWPSSISNVKQRCRCPGLAHNGDPGVIGIAVQVIVAIGLGGRTDTSGFT